MKFWNWLRRLLGWPIEAPVPRPPHTPLVAKARGAPLAGDLLQFPRSKGRATTDVVVGFDFGTSCTRAAIQSPFKLGGRTVIVDFGDLAHAASAHLLPVALFVEQGNELGLRPAAAVGAARRHLKVALLDSALAPEADKELARNATAWAAAYVGLVLREVRRFFLSTQAESYGSDTLRWAMNLGIPSAGYDDAAIRQRFTAVARAGWLLSVRQSRPTLAAAYEAVDQIALSGPPGVEIEVVPEVAAQVVGYAKSRHRRDGLHLLLDVGASTLDLCAFRLLAEDGDDKYALLTADVRRLGLLELHRRRVQACGGQPPFSSTPDDFVQQLPDLAGSQINGPTLGALRACDEQYVNECARQMLLRTVSDLRLKRDPHSRRWTEGLPFFVCGGGARSRVVQDVVRLADSIALSVWHPYAGVRQWSLPLPTSVVGPPSQVPQEFARLSVAFGLSFPTINIGTIQRPSEIPDVFVNQRPRNWQSLYVDKSQV